jgi:hypothetical protein
VLVVWERLELTNEFLGVAESLEACFCLLFWVLREFVDGRFEVVWRLVVDGFGWVGRRC